jgi:sulfhydrogenase subunit beta (sulfur reductase)
MDDADRQIQVIKMETVFIKNLKPFLDALAEEFELYVPRKTGKHYVFASYDPASTSEAELNNIRTCMPVKEFLFPLRQIAAVMPGQVKMGEVKPFAVFGLKDCDLKSLAALDMVFKEDEFIDPYYVAHRDKMFVISGDCFEPGESCCCNLFDGQPFSEEGFDLNLAKIRGGFVVEAGSQKGEDFLKKHGGLFSPARPEMLSERQKIRKETQQQLLRNTAEYKLDSPIKEIMDNSGESSVFDVEAERCVECQACTRVCPTCHCFYLYDTKRKDYFEKMQMWDSCMRLDYAKVAGGANPRKILGERLRHRLMHKFSYFLDRYGVNMCVGCGRCVDADAGKIDIRVILKKLNEELNAKQGARIAK